MSAEMNKEIDNRFRTLSVNLQNALGEAVKNPFIVSHSLPIDCDELPDSILDIGIYTHPKFEKFFEQLEGINKPIVYFFQIVSNHTNQQLFDKISEYKEKKHKHFPALKKGFNADTRILYVGKKKHHIKSRMFVHLGYYNVVGTQGLQLCHWARGLGLKLELKIIELPFDSITSGLITHYEIELAKILNPLAGKHR